MFPSEVGQLTTDQFAVGIQRLRARYSATCCHPKANITAVDRLGNIGTCTVDLGSVCESREVGLERRRGCRETAWMLGDGRDVGRWGGGDTGRRRDMLGMLEDVGKFWEYLEVLEMSGDCWGCQQTARMSQECEDVRKWR